jgi:hypothetical protein
MMPKLRMYDPVFEFNFKLNLVAAFSLSLSVSRFETNPFLVVISAPIQLVFSTVRAHLERSTVAQQTGSTCHSRLALWQWNRVDVARRRLHHLARTDRSDRTVDRTANVLCKSPSTVTPLDSSSCRQIHSQLIVINLIVFHSLSNRSVLAFSLGRVTLVGSVAWAPARTSDGLFVATHLLHLNTRIQSYLSVSQYAAVQGKACLAHHWMHQRIRKRSRSAVLARYRSIPTNWIIFSLIFPDSFPLINLVRGVGNRHSNHLLVRWWCDQVFGAVLSNGLHTDKMHTYYGTGETFLFTFHPDFEVFKWSGVNCFFIKSSFEYISIGGGE